ncbi:MAG TPA: DMT family transporter [Vicinamibacterales bacterium]|nr:DMT family transporter [Vicinamibacterales bacterium]
MTRLDALLLLMTLIWGTNYSIVKFAFAEIDAQAFNAARMGLASLVFLGLMAAIRRLRARRGLARPAADEDSLASIFVTSAPITPRDWMGLAGLGLVGHCLYQFLFIGGLARTSVANSSLILAATPVLIALATAVLGHDRVGLRYWIGATLSMAGIYVVIGEGFRLDPAAIGGDLMVSAAVCCWAAYTIGARQLMARHSPVGVTGLSMSIGTLLYVPLVAARVHAAPWGALPAATWLALLYSSLFALCVAYTIWYAAVRRIGSARTSVYSNVVPIVAMGTAVLFLGEPIGPSKVLGATAVLAGVALTRTEPRNPATRRRGP